MTIAESAGIIIEKTTFTEEIMKLIKNVDLCGEIVDITAIGRLRGEGLDLMCAIVGGEV